MIAKKILIYKNSKVVFNTIINKEIFIYLNITHILNMCNKTFKK